VGAIERIERERERKVYTACFYTWPFPTECAVDFIESSEIRI
jgi:hypothetical protein